MTTGSDNGVLAQILAQLNTLGERLAVVETDLKTVIRDHTKDLDDHETRIRLLETVAREAVTRAELEAAATARDVANDRKANIRIAVVVAVVAVINGAIAWLH